MSQMSGSSIALGVSISLVYDFETKFQDTRAKLNLRKNHIRYFGMKFQLFQLNDRKEIKKTLTKRQISYWSIDVSISWEQNIDGNQNDALLCSHVLCFERFYFIFFCFTVSQMYLPLRESFSVRCSISTTANTKRIHKKWMRHSLL